MLRGYRLPRARRLDERGATAVMTALLAVPLIGVSALAVDVGIWQMNKSAMQGAADQALHAAGLAKAAGGSAENEARGIAAAHGFVHGSEDHNRRKTTVTVGVPTVGTYAGNANALEVLITQPQQTFLSSVIAGFSAPVASARAVGVGGGGGKVCIMTLPTADTGLTVRNGSALQTVGCNIYVNSKSNDPCAMDVSEGSNVNTPGIFVGSSDVCKSTDSNINSTKNINSPTKPDPYSGRTSPNYTPTCTQDIVATSQIISKLPGTYCKIFLDTNSILNLTSGGIYIINGSSIEVKSGSIIRGNDVTIFMVNGISGKSITISGGSNVEIKAKTTGSTKGIGLWIDNNGLGILSLFGNSNLKMTGAIYAPNTLFNMSGGANLGGTICMQIIAKKFVVGDSNVSLNHNCTGVGVEDILAGGGAFSLKE